MVNRQYGIRLSVQGERELERDLERAGREGQQAMGRIERGAREASVGLRTLDVSARTTQAGMSSLAARAGALGAVLGRGGALFLGVTALAGALVGLGAATKNALADVAAIGDAADQAQIDPALFQDVTIAIEAAGQSTEGLDRSLQRFNQTIGDASQGLGEGLRAFEQLGISITDTQGRLRPTGEILLAVSDALAGIEDPARRSAIAADLFGRNYGALLATLGDGSQSFVEATERARELGRTYSTETIRDVQALNAELEIQSSVIDVQLKTALVALGPILVDLTTGFAKFVRGVAEGVDTIRDAVTLSPEQSVSAAQGQLDDLLARLALLEQIRADLLDGTPYAGATDALIADVRSQVETLTGEVEGLMTSAMQARVDALREQIGAIDDDLRKAVEDQARELARAEEQFRRNSALARDPQEEDLVRQQLDTARIAVLERAEEKAAEIVERNAEARAELEGILAEWGEVLSAATDTAEATEKTKEYVDASAQALARAQVIAERLPGAMRDAAAETLSWATNVATVARSLADIARISTDPADYPIAPGTPVDTLRTAPREGTDPARAPLDAFAPGTEFVVSPDAPRTPPAVTRPGGGGTPPAETVNPVEGVLARVRDQIAATTDEAEALRRLLLLPAERRDNAALEGLQVELDLIRAIAEAKEAGVEISAEQEAAYRAEAAALGQQVTARQRGIDALEDERRASEDALREQARRQEEFDRFLQSSANSLGAAIAGTRDWSDALKQLTADLAEAALQAALFGDGPLGGLFGGGLGSLFGGATGGAFGGVVSAKGNVFEASPGGPRLVPFQRGGVFAPENDGPGLVPFARGGVVDRAQMFPMSDGRTGLMAEAGPEAIMPLQRGAAGDLGVLVAMPGGTGPEVLPLQRLADGRLGVAPPEMTADRLFDAPRRFAMGDVFERGVPSAFRAASGAASMMPGARTAEPAPGPGQAAGPVNVNLTYAPVIQARDGEREARVAAAAAYERFRAETPGIVLDTMGEFTRAGGRL